MSVHKWRLELFFKAQSELSAKRIPFIKEHDVQRLNLTNKVSQHGHCNQLKSFNTQMENAV